jgi:hypothetical protein
MKEYYALGWTKRKIFAFELSPARVESGAWGQRKPDYEVDMEILRGLEHLGAPWDSMGRVPVIKKQPGIIKTIDANMILWNVPGNSDC